MTMCPDVDELLFDAFDSKDVKQLASAVIRKIETQSTSFVVHPLGFYMARLIHRDLSSVRLHYWSPECRALTTALTPYHDHVWALRSCVLHGCVENVGIELIPSLTGDYELADIAQSSGVDAVVLNGTRVNIQVSSRACYNSNSFYDVPVGAFHYSVVDTSRPTISVVRANIVTRSRPRTLIPVGTLTHAPTRTVVPNSASLAAEILQILSPMLTSYP